MSEPEEESLEDFCDLVGEVLDDLRRAIDDATNDAHAEASSLDDVDAREAMVSAIESLEEAIDSAFDRAAERLYS